MRITNALQYRQFSTPLGVARGTQIVSNFYPLQSDGVLRYVLFLFCTPSMANMSADQILFLLIWLLSLISEVGTPGMSELSCMVWKVSTVHIVRPRYHH